MKPKRLLAALLLAMLAALVLALPASAGASAGAPLATLEANLTGEKEVPGPGDPDGRGHAVVNVYRAKVCYTLEVNNIEPSVGGQEDPGAHIHLGLRDETGPIVVQLEPPGTDGFSEGCVQIPRALSRGLREHPARYYVNVHNAEFPAGAIRGQLHRA